MTDVTYCLIYIGYEGYIGGFKERFRSGYEKFCETYKKYMKEDMLVHIDGVVKEGCEQELIDVYSELWEPDFVKPLFKIEKMELFTLHHITKIIDELNYCDISMYSAPRLTQSFQLKNGNKFVVIELEAESG